MTCTPMTKQSNGRSLTDCSGDPNVWYMLAQIPWHIRDQTPCWRGNSDSEDDSARLSWSTGWDEWNEEKSVELRPTALPPPT